MDQILYWWVFRENRPQLLLVIPESTRGMVIFEARVLLQQFI